MKLQWTPITDFALEALQEMVVVLEKVLAQEQVAMVVDAPLVAMASPLVLQSWKVGLSYVL